jgi:hypothetical protein
MLIIKMTEKLESFLKLIRFILRQSQVVVFGNMTKHLVLFLQEIQKSFPTIRVVVTSPYQQRCVFPSTETIRFVDYHSIASEHCDLLILVEPLPNVSFKKPVNVSRFVVFTSHLNFTADDIVSYVSYFHDWESIVAPMKRLLDIQEPAVQSESPLPIYADSTILKGSEPVQLSRYSPEKIVVYIDDDKEMHLSFLDAVYFLLHRSGVESWVVCFQKPTYKKKLDQFFQRTIDRLHCIRFDAGNLTDVRDILKVIPFYRSGVVDYSCESKLFSFGNVKYVALDSIADACRAVMKYNLVHLVGPMYAIVE